MLVGQSSVDLGAGKVGEQRYMSCCVACQNKTLTQLVTKYE
jgi:hypothetical protein